MTANSIVKVSHTDWLQIPKHCLRVRFARRNIFCLDMFGFFFFFPLMQVTKTDFRVLNKVQVSNTVCCRNWLCDLQVWLSPALCFVFCPIGCGCFLAPCLPLQCLVSFEPYLAQILCCFFLALSYLKCQDMLFVDLNKLLGELQLYLFIALLLFVHWLYICVNTCIDMTIDLFGLLSCRVIIAVCRLRNVFFNIIETGNKSHCVLWENWMLLCLSQLCCVMFFLMFFSCRRTCNLTFGSSTLSSLLLLLSSLMSSCSSYPFVPLSFLSGPWGDQQNSPSIQIGAKGRCQAQTGSRRGLLQLPEVWSALLRQGSKEHTPQIS